MSRRQRQRPDIDREERRDGVVEGRPREEQATSARGEPGGAAKGHHRQRVDLRHGDAEHQRAGPGEEREHDGADQRGFQQDAHRDGEHDRAQVAAQVLEVDGVRAAVEAQREKPRHQRRVVTAVEQRPDMSEVSACESA
ncbi:hypothetical protein Airi02_038250 [Actinoallomurus iriomotensis]|uniref:Uncharacterized protein n=1 Tax=Actinoallomurus iriomotensis TaxID=478107 RepID=A0A9W6W1F0_9ACTN|nr:hypothetical protein Airi02_038250 [Actinoallomurus iriomotensis]